MKLLNFRIQIAFLGVLLLSSCSPEEEKQYTFSDFEGKKYLSEAYGQSSKAELFFAKESNELRASNIPWNVSFSRKYEILSGDLSPSGKPTISVDSEYYFLISGSRLIFRYYESESEKTIVFRESSQ